MKQMMLRFADKISRVVKPDGPVIDQSEGILSPAEQAFFLGRERNQIGRWAEDRGAAFLCSRGVKLLGRNVRERFSEIDIVGDDRGELIFVEVRCRRVNPAMSAVDTLGPQKWRRLARGAELYVQSHNWNDSWRVDLVAIDVDIPIWRLKWYKYLEMQEAGSYGS